MNEATELRGDLDTFFDSLIFTVTDGNENRPQSIGPELKEKLLGLCKLDGTEDEERVKTALMHTRQVAEALDIMTTDAKWDRLSAGELFKHLIREVEEELPEGAQSDRESKFEEFLSSMRDAVDAVTPYQMTLAYLHDIGKLRTRRDHEFESAEMIVREELLKQLGVPEDTALVMEAAVKYHLILPSIFTGSYSMLSFLPVNDDPLVRQIKEQGLTKRFLDALYLISVADVAGLGKITRIKIDNFDLREPLLNAFGLEGAEFEGKLQELDRERVMTRLASLRCFNKMELKHQDLDRYIDYVEEARDALKTMECFGVDDAGWEAFLDFLPRMASFGYSIGFLYTFGATGDDGVPGSQKKISPRLFGVLEALSRLMKQKEKEEGWSRPLWEISFINSPGFWDEEFKKLMAWMVRDESIAELLTPDRVSYKVNNGLKVLVVDFSGLPPQ